MPDMENGELEGMDAKEVDELPARCKLPLWQVLIFNLRSIELIMLRTPACVRMFIPLL